MADNNQESALARQLRELQASMEDTTIGVRDAFRMFKEDVGSKVDIFGITPASIIPKFTKMNIVIGAFGAALGATIAILKNVNEEARKYRDVTERLAVINKDRREGSQELLKQQGELLGGLRRNSEILSELQILGLTQVNKNLLELGTRLQISGQSMAGFKELTSSMLRFSSMNEDGLDNLAENLIRISKNTNTTLETLIDATKMSAGQAASLTFLGGADAVENMASMRMLLQAVGGEQLGGQLVGLMDAISNISLSQAQMLGIEKPIDRMLDAPNTPEAIDILTKEILPRLETRLNRSRDLVGMQVSTEIFGADLLEKTILASTALEKLGLSSEGLNDQLKKVARQQASEQDKVATMMEAFRSRMEEAFSRTAEVQEEATTDFDLSLMALKGSFSTLMATLAPFGNMIGRLLTKVNFALAKLVLGLAAFVEDIKDFFGRGNEELADRIAMQRELVAQLQDMEGVTGADRQRMLSEILQAENFRGLGDVQEELDSFARGVRDATDNIRSTVLDQTQLIFPDMTANDALFQSLARLEDRILEGSNIFPAVQAALADGFIDARERDTAVAELERRVGVDRVTGRPIIEEAFNDMNEVMEFIRRNENDANLGMLVDKMEEALVVIAEERQADRVVAGLDTLAKLTARVADEIPNAGGR